MKVRLEGFKDIIYGLLVIVGCCVGAAMGVLGSLWIYSTIGLANDPSEEFSGALAFLMVIVGGIGGFIIGGVAAGWLIVKLSNRK